MRRLSRLDKSIDLLRPRSTTPLSSPSLCTACRNHRPFSSSLHRVAESSKLSATERLRRKIWGTDEPPGLDDPYGGSGTIEKRKAARQDEPKYPIDKAEKELRTAQDASLDPSYEPAETWDGLQEVGELPAEEFEFEGFFPTETVSDPYEAIAALHRAIVEVYTLKQAGRSLSELSKSGRGSDKTGDVQISVSRSKASAPLLHYAEIASEEVVLRSIIQDNSAITEEPIQITDAKASDATTIEPPTKTGANEFEPSEVTLKQLQITPYETQVASWGKSWLQTSLDDPKIKFAVVKRVMHLTGIRIPDPAIKSSRSVFSLVPYLTTKPKPTKLAEALAEKPDLVNLPNVKIFDRRVTPIDEEKMVGRWKIIEKELNSRGLPITGH